MIRRATLSDIGEIVKLHIENLKDGLLYILGEDILRLFYNDLIADKNSFVLLYSKDDKILGIAASTLDANRFFRDFKNRNIVKLISKMLEKSIKNPLLPFQFIFSEKYPKEPKAELLMLFVDRRSRGKNIGTYIVKKTIGQFKKMSVDKFKITILSTNMKGREFYRKRNFTDIGEFNYLGELRNIYVCIAKNTNK